MGKGILLKATVLLACIVSQAWGIVSTPLRPPMYPLAVRSPYLSTWIKGSHDGISDTMPEFWNGQTIGWTALLKVNGTVYSVLGSFPGGINYAPATQLSQSYSTSTSTFRFDVSGVVVELVFRNPVTPTDYCRQSLPLSYLEILISSFSKYDSIDLYVDVNGAWVSGDQANFISWDVATINKTNPIVSHKIRRTLQQEFTEIGDMAEWGELYWSTSDTHNLTISSGHSAVNSRKHFAAHGNLTNTVDDEFRPINLAEPVFAFSKSFKPSKSHQSALFTVGLLQDEVIQLNMPEDGYRAERPLFKQYFEKDSDMVQWHYNDYTNSKLDLFDIEVIRDSNTIDPELLSITSLSAVQAIGGTQLIASPGNSSTEPWLFMKEISSDGNMQTIDVIYPAFPFFLYSNPKLMVALLEPLLIHQEGGLYPNNYAMHDLGASYPNATGHLDGADEYMPVEECGNILIMMLATHEGLIGSATDSNVKESAKAWLTRHYDIALQWTQYLIDYGLITENQLSTDDFAGRLANQTNLAVKAIVGIKSMSRIANITGHSEKAEDLDKTAKTYLKQWLELAYDEGIAFSKLAYQWHGSWGSLYNLYGDKLLGLDLFPEFIYGTQDAWYQKVLEPYGLPLDSRHLYTKSDWQMFIASFSSPTLAGELYARISQWLDETPTQRPMIDLYETTTGENAVNMFTNRPVVGAHFAALAMQKMRAERRTRSGVSAEDASKESAPRLRFQKPSDVSKSEIDF